MKNIRQSSIVGIFSIGLLFVGLVLWWWFRPVKEIVPSKTKPPKSASVVSNQMVKPSVPLEKTNKWTNPDGSYKPWTGGVFNEKSDPNHSDPRWLEVRRRNKMDRDWQWKMPINFYGKVVDENGNPVEEAEITFSWTDLSPEGTSKHITSSDSQGLFSLTTAQGKHLLVKVEKEGYYTSHQQGRSSFEYADFGEDTFHEADSNNPVIFHLKKKGEAEPLIYLEKEVPIQLNVSVTMDLKMGKIGSTNGQLQVTLLENQGKLKQWSMVLTVPNGGIVPAMEEFPTTAPEDGYSSAITLDINSKLPPRWVSVYKGGRFYIRLQDGYCLIELKMVPGGEYFRLISYLNPSGSRNLEYDEAKQINK